VDLIKVCGVIFSLIAFLITIRLFGRRYNWHPEWQRKILHLGLGVTAISFTWFFSKQWQVLVVCAASIAILLMIRTIPQLRNSVGKAVFDVNRSSLGELFFAISIVLLFWLSHGNKALYVIPIAILTISDAVAALVGTHYGKKLFKVIDGNKSWEGTLAFAGVTFTILLVLLYLLTPISWAALLMIAIMFSILGALIEAVSWNGLDNLFVPLATYLFLSSTLNQDEIQLFYQLSALSGLVLLGLAAGPKSQLNTHALMAGIILLYFFWVAGSIVWVVAPILIFITHLAMVKIYKDEGSYTFNAVLSVMSGGFFWLAIEKLFHFPYSFFLFTLALAIHLQIILLLRLKAYRGKAAEPRIVLFTSLGCAGLLLSTTFFHYGISNQLIALHLYAILLMFLGGVFINVTADRFGRKRWSIEALFALTGSALALIPIGIMRLL